MTTTKDEKKPGRLPVKVPAWVALTAAMGGFLLIIPLVFKGYVSGGFGPGSGMKILLMLLSPMLPFIALAGWRGLEMPDEAPRTLEDAPLNMVVGDKPPPPRKTMGLEGWALVCAGVCCVLGLLFLTTVGVGWPLVLCVLGIPPGVAVAAYGHVRRLNRPPEED